MTIQVHETTIAEGPLVPEHTALMIIDMRDRVVHRDPLAQPEDLATLDRINNLAADCRAAGVTVIHTRFCTGGGEPAEPHGTFATKAGDVIVNSPTPDGLHRSEIQAVLHSRHIDSVILAGISADTHPEIAPLVALMNCRVFVLSDGGIPTDPSEKAVHQSQPSIHAGSNTAGPQVLTVDRMTQTIIWGLRMGDRPHRENPRREIPEPRSRRSRVAERLFPDRTLATPT